MDELIRKQDAIEAINVWLYCDKDERMPADVIKALPPVQPRTGKWILCDNQNEEDVANGNYLYKCSECGRSDLHAKTQKVPHCWWCGAIMEIVDGSVDNPKYFTLS